MAPSRIERDSLGERELPGDLYYGIQTARAVENFPISGFKPYSELIDATVQIKKAAARVNSALGALELGIAAAIERAGQAAQRRRQIRVDEMTVVGSGTDRTHVAQNPRQRP